MRMHPYRHRGPGSWAYVVVTGRGRWWGICKAGRDLYLDLGRWRVSRRNTWAPLFTEVHRFGPIQWWTSRAWDR